MALTPNFTVSQVVGEPSEIVLVDTSTGSDLNITQRRVYLNTAYGTKLVPEGTSTEYIQWAYSLSSITIDALDKDYALSVTVQWLDVSNTVLYDKTIDTGLTLYNETWNYGRTQMLSGNPLLINDDGFFDKKSLMRTFIDDGNQCVTFQADIFGAQQCYDLGTQLRLNYP